MTETANAPFVSERCPKCNTMLSGRHCLRSGCGFSRPLARATPDFNPLQQAIDAEASSVAQANRDGLTSVMVEYNITIPLGALSHWRPTVRASGTVNGLEHLGDLTVVATDGCIAWFVGDDRPICGHVDWFDGHVETLHKVSKESVPKEKKMSARKRLMMSI